MRNQMQTKYAYTYVDNLSITMKSGLGPIHFSETRKVNLIQGVH